MTTNFPSAPITDVIAERIRRHTSIIDRAMDITEDAYTDEGIAAREIIRTAARHLYMATLLHLDGPAPRTSSARVVELLDEFEARVARLNPSDLNMGGL